MNHQGTKTDAFVFAPFVLFLAGPSVAWVWLRRSGARPRWFDRPGRNRRTGRRRGSIPPPPSRTASAGPRQAGDRGFTIIEVAMTVFVLALALTTSITTLQRAFLNLDTARNLSTASAILQTEMEKERLFTWAKVSDATYQPAMDASYLRNPDIAGRFSLSRTVTALAERSGKVVQVTLTARWRSYDGRQLSRSFTTYFTQGGLNDFFYD